MAKITDFNLVFEPNINNVNIKDIEVNIYKNIQFNRRLEMLSDIINESADDTKYYNIGKLKIFFTLFTVQYYTDIEMDEEDLSEAFDAAKETGLLGKVLAAIPEEEYNYLFSQMEEMKKIRERNEESFVTKIGKLVTDLPEKMSAAVDMINNFDKSKYAEAMNFAKALNGGRDIQ